MNLENQEKHQDAKLNLENQENHQDERFNLEIQENNQDERLNLENKVRRIRPGEPTGFKVEPREQ